MSTVVSETPDCVHPLADIIANAAAGTYLPADGGWHRVPPWRSGLEAIVSITGHAVLALQSDIPDEILIELGVDGVGGAQCSPPNG